MIIPANVFLPRPPTTSAEMPDYLRRLNVVLQNQYGLLAVALNGVRDVVGAVVASASTITPTGTTFHVTGTSAIETISPLTAGWTGTITVIPDGAFTTVTTGNIALASAAVVGKALAMTYDGTKWYPSYTA